MSLNTSTIQIRFVNLISLFGLPKFKFSTLQFYAAKEIDDPTNLADDKVFLFSGTADNTVTVGAIFRLYCAIKKLIFRCCVVVS